MKKMTKIQKYILTAVFAGVIIISTLNGFVGNDSSEVSAEQGYSEYQQDNTFAPF